MSTAPTSPGKAPLLLPFVAVPARLFDVPPGIQPGLGTTTDLENYASKMRFLHSKPYIPTFKHVWSKLWRWLFQIHIFNQWPKTFKTLQYFLYLLVIYFENAHAQNMHRMPYIVPKSHGHWIAMGTTRHFFHLGNRHRLAFLICVCLGMLPGLTPHRLWSGAHHLRSLAMERVLFLQLVCFATCEYHVNFKHKMWCHILKQTIRFKISRANSRKHQKTTIQKFLSRVPSIRPWKISFPGPPDAFGASLAALAAMPGIRQIHW
jgi:hypothetical protein